MAVAYSMWLFGVVPRLTNAGFTKSGVQPAEVEPWIGEGQSSSHC